MGYQKVQDLACRKSVPALKLIPVSLMSFSLAEVLPDVVKNYHSREAELFSFLPFLEFF